MLFRQCEYGGQWKTGNRHGFGVLKSCIDDTVIYEGEWLDGAMHGRGRRTYKSGNEYSGFWIAGQRTGFGEMQWFTRGQRYIGTWKDNSPDGWGIHTWIIKRLGRGARLNDGLLRANEYRGQFSKGKRHGLGVFFYSDGSEYRGEWKNDLKEGQGMFTARNGVTHVVEFVIDKLTMLDGKNITNDNIKLPIGLSHINADSIDVASVMDYQKFLVNSNQLSVGEGDFIEDPLNSLIRNRTNLRYAYKLYADISTPAGESHKLLTNCGFWQFCVMSEILTQDLGISNLNRIVSKPSEKELTALLNTINSYETITLSSQFKQEVDWMKIFEDDIHHPLRPMLPSHFYRAIVRILAFSKINKSQLVHRLEHFFEKKLPLAVDRIISQRIDDPLFTHWSTDVVEQLTKWITKIMAKIKGLPDKATVDSSQIAVDALVLLDETVTVKEILLFMKRYHLVNLEQKSDAIMLNEKCEPSPVMSNDEWTREFIGIDWASSAKDICLLLRPIEVFPLRAVDVLKELDCEITKWELQSFVVRLVDIKTDSLKNIRMEDKIRYFIEYILKQN
eukprot:GHVL01031047.1.p2 GENE.GHVL01031047.1~~GHVL01031047.1.p2  ORF type:complete len:560 (+),score=76.22 GHVL01031047.1:334-2013(+)